MKTVYLIRHAKSSWSHPELADYERPLNHRGKKDAPFMANFFHDIEKRKPLLVTSPATRAMTTCLAFAKELGIKPHQIITEPDIYEAYPGTIIRIIQDFDDEVDCVCLFGHNPSITEVSNWFADEPIPNVPTCGIVRLFSTAQQWKDFSPENGQVLGSYFPKDFK